MTMTYHSGTWETNATEKVKNPTVLYGQRGYEYEKKLA